MNSSNTILLTGLPRAGTTLSCHILNRCRDVLALHEPLTPSDFDPAKGLVAAVEQIGAFAQVSRQRVFTEGLALSRQKDGQVPENPVATEPSSGGLRPMDASLGLIDVSQQFLSDDFHLVIKHNALFTALLQELAQAFPVYAIVRNPLAVLASWNLVDLPVNQGHIPAAEQFDLQLKQALANIPGRLDRQLHILEWFCQRYVRYLPDRLLRYEDFVVRPSTLAVALGLDAGGMAVPLRESRNTGYDMALMEQLYARLSGYGDAIWHVYSRAQVDELMESIRAAA